MSAPGRSVIAPGATVNLSNANSVTLGRTLENGGTITQTGAGGIGLNGGSITNRAGALFDNQSAASFSLLGGTPEIDNAGTFRRSINAGSTTVPSGVTFNNYGLIDLQAGTLLCSGTLANSGTVNLASGTTNRNASGGSSSGTWSLPAGSLVEWVSGPFGTTLASGTQLNGAGLYRVNGAVLNHNATLSVANLDLVSGTLSSSAGTPTLTVSNVMNWTGGTMSAPGRTTIAPGATLYLANAGSVTLGRTLENGGTATQTGIGGVGLNGGAITNRAGALFDNQSGASFTLLGGTPEIDNAGTFRKSIATGTTTVPSGVTFNNYGLVDLQVGTLVCGGSLANNGTVSLASGTTNRNASGGSSSGTWNAPAGSLVEWVSGAFGTTLSSGAHLNGSGIYRLNGASLTCNATLPVANLDFFGGTFNGSGTVTVTNTMNWTGGAMSLASGSTVIAPGATLSLANAASVSLGRTLENGGTVIQTGAGGIGFNGGYLTNRAGALFDNQTAVTFSYVGGAPAFDNGGIFRKSLNAGTTTFNASVPFNNYGTVDIESGILLANGGFTPRSGALLNCAIGGTVPGTNYGRLQVAGTVTLNGGLSVVLTNGYLPTTSDTFTVVTAGTRSGTFASFTFPSNQVAMQLSNTSTSVVVGVSAVFPPPPVISTPHVSGTNFMLTWSSISNATYRVEFKPDLAFPTWTPLPGDVTATSSTAFMLDPLTPSNRFYHVRTVP
jgi:hypothetical protein